MLQGINISPEHGWKSTGVFVKAVQTYGTFIYMSKVDKYKTKIKHNQLKILHPN
jgi:hypothetical protein